MDFKVNIKNVPTLLLKFYMKYFNTNTKNKAVLKHVTPMQSLLPSLYFLFPKAKLPYIYTITIEVTIK